MIVQHTPFFVEKINASLSYYRNEYNLEILPKSVADYGASLQKLPVCYDTNLNELTRHLLDSNYLTGCTFSISSGTSNNYKLLSQRIWRSITPDSYPSQLVRMLIQNNVFNQEDIVANLFSAGGMSTLYDGFNRILEACKTTILPIGRLNTFSQQKFLFLDYMSRTKVNTLIGTPSSIVQCAKLSQEANKSIPIKKIIYTGEMFSCTKELYVHSIFPI